MERVGLSQPAESGSFDASFVRAIFVRALGSRLDASARARIREAGLDLDRPLSGSYERERVLAGVAAAASALFPELDAAAAHRRLGAELVRGFTLGWKARAALAAARAAGVERTLAKLVGHHRTPSDFLELDLASDAPGRYALELNLGAPHPEILLGLAEAVLETLGARGAEVRLASTEPRERLEVRLRGR